MLLHYAAKWGDLETIRRLVTAGRSINEPEWFMGETPLMWALRSPHTDLAFLEALVELGADVNARSKRGTTTLSMAPDAERLACLLDKGAALRAAVENRSGELVRSVLDLDSCRLLLNAGLDPNEDLGLGDRPLIHAIWAKKPEVIDLLLANGADADRISWDPLRRAIWMGTAEDVRRVLNEGFPPHHPEPSSDDPWFDAITEGDLGKCQAFLEAGADLYHRDHIGRTALAIAAGAGQVHIVRWLLEMGLPIDDRDESDETALIEACEAGSTEIVAILLETGADVEATDDVRTKPIDVARNIDIVRQLVDRGADIDYVNGQGYSLLINAAGEGDETMVRGLLELGANLETTSTGETALHAAVWGDERRIVRILLEAGADPNAQDVDGRTPLHGARSPQVAQMLLEAGADPSIADDSGDPPVASLTEPEVLEVIRGASAYDETEMGNALSHAVESGNLELAKYHLAHGAPAEWRSEWGETPLMISAERSDAVMVALLTQSRGESRNRGQGRPHAAPPGGRPGGVPRL
ncbi:hypothetical protein BH11ARM2_BH11ARM2_38060 [soil metagenome]